jgi:transposase
MEQTAVFKLCVKLKTTATETFEMLKSAYGGECLSRTGVFEWHRRFKEGRESLQDDERKGRPSTSRTEESMEVIQKCLAEDRTLSVRMLEEMTGINREKVRKILVEDFKKKKLCARFCSLFVYAVSKT